MKWLRKMLDSCMLSCKRASELVEKKIHFKLTYIEKLQLNMHTLMCDVCKTYQKKSQNMDATLQAMFQRGPQSTQNVSLSDESKEEIIRKLEENH